MAEQPHTTKDFELPVGLYKDGALYKRGTMRAMKAGDTLAVFRDGEYQDVLSKIKSGTIKISVRALESLRDTLGEAKDTEEAQEDNREVELDPIMMQNQQVLQIVRACVLLPLLIIEVEGIERKASDMGPLNRKDVKEMSERDVNYLMGLTQQVGAPSTSSGRGESHSPLL